MALIRPVTPGEDWYQLVQQHYPSSHTDTGAERQQALLTLHELEKSGSLTAEQFIQKIQLISRHHVSHRYKLSTLIAGRFWEQQLQTTGIQAKAYEVPKPWAGNTTDVLRP